MNAVLKLELIVGLLASFTMLTIFIWSVTRGGFDDSKKMMDGMLFDSEEDLQDAVNKENKQKALKEKKLKDLEKSKEED